MKRTNQFIVGALTILGIAAALVSVLASRQRPSFWTDAAAIRVPAGAAPVRQILWRPAEPLPSAINTATDEYEPRLSTDGLTLVLVRRRAGANADLFTSRWAPSGWSDPAPIPEINTEADELGPELSSDGNSLYFYSDRVNGLGGFDLWRSGRTPDRWSEPVNLGPAVNSPFNEYGPALAPDGSRLYFSSNRPRANEPAASPESWSATLRERRTRHDYDLYTSDLTAAEPAPAQPLDTLNTPHDEGSPAISPVGDFLYFASDRPGGRGGYDLYRSRLLRAATLSPENLGDSVNSAANDLDPGLSTDGFRLYFSSDRTTPPPQTLGLTTDADTTPNTDAPPALALQPVQPADYGLWWTSSREVFLEHEPMGPTLAQLWSDIWPWLLALFALLTLLLLMVRLASDPRWRTRFGTLSLLARCLVLSLAAHIIIASLLTLWRVGSRLDQLLQSGGTRVVLASSAFESDGLTSNGLEAQINAPASDGIPDFDTPSAIIPALPVPSASLALMVLAPQPAMPDRALPSVNVTPPDASPRANPVALDPRSPASEPLAASLPAASTPVSPVNEPAAETPTASAPASAPAILSAAPFLATLDPQTPVASEAAVPPLPSTDTPHIAPTVPLPPLTLAPSSIDRSDTRIPAASLPAASTSEPASATIASLDPGPAPLSVPAPRAPASTTLAPAPLARTSETPPLDTSRLTHESAEPTHSPASCPGSALPALVFIASEAPALPKSVSPVASPNTTGEAATTLPAAPASTGTLPTAAAPRSIRFDSLNLPRMTAREAAPLGNLPDLTVSPARANLSPSITSPAMPQLGAADLTSSLRLPPTPAILAEPAPKPLETFTQRNPETRADILNQMGGSPETERAVALALDWFARHQASDGRWSSRTHEGQIDADAGMTSLALLCFLSAGHTHIEPGPYQTTVSRALNWLLSRQGPDGDLRRGETMYGQTIATVALCEAYAMTREPALADPARRAVAFVLARADASRRGRARPEDTSVLGWQVMAVEAARRAGIDVPRDTFDAARTFLDAVSSPSSRGHYAHAPGDRPNPAMTAEAMFVQQLVGRTRQDPRMADSARFILQTPPRWEAGAPTYYWYYATLALFQHQGDEWRAWNEAVVRELLANQRPEGDHAGSWDPKDEWSRLGGRVYQTAVCTLTLEVYYRYRAAPAAASTSEPR